MNELTISELIVWSNYPFFSKDWFVAIQPMTLSIGSIV